MSESVITHTAEDQRKSNPKAAMVRAETRSARGYANQRAHDLRIGPQPDYVDISLSPFNRILLPPPPAPEMRRVAEERRAQRETSRALKSNAGIAVIGVIGFGTEAAHLFSKLTQEQQDQAILAAGHKIAEVAKTTMVGAVVHVDETTVHAHLSFYGYDEDGLPLSTTMKRGMLTKFQDVLAEVMAEHCPGIERGNSKWKRIEAGASYAETVHKTVAEMHGTLRQEHDALVQRNKALALEVDAKVARVAEMQERVDELESKEGRLTDAQEKRLTTYKNRLANRQAELSTAREELSSHKAELDSLTTKIRDLDARKESSEEDIRSLDRRVGTLEATIEDLEAQKANSEAALAPLKDQKATLTAEVQGLTAQEAQARAAARQAQDEKVAAEAAARQAEEDRRSAAEAAEAARTAQRTAEAALAPLEHKRAALTAEIQGLTAQEAQARAAARQALNEKAAAEAAARQAEEDRRSAAEAAEAARTAQRAAEAALTPLKDQKAALTAEIGTLEEKEERYRRTLDWMTLVAKELRPAHEIALVLKRIAEENSQDPDRFLLMMPPREPYYETEEGRDTWATALRMVDPFFAPNVAPDVQRGIDPEVNAMNLTDASAEDYHALVEVMKSEPGDHHGAVSGILEGEYGLLSLNDKWQREEPGVTWISQAFAGLKRGLAFAVAAVSEQSVALAGVFEALPSTAKAALSRLFSAQDADTQQKEAPRPRRSVFDLGL